LRVAVYHSNDDVRVERRPRPVPGPGELLLRVRASGLCGSDVMEWYRRPRAPQVLGHEVAGEVAETGEGVTAFAAGDRVVATHHVPCDRCRYCATDRHSVCETLRTTRFDPGGFAEFVRLSAPHVERGTLRLPDTVSFEAGSFVEPLACVVRAQRVSRLRAGDSVAVLGAGVSGILQLQHARLLGAGPLYATDVRESKLEAARRFGADAAFRADADAVGSIRAAQGGRGVDQVIVCTGARQAAEQALALVERGGTILFFAPLAAGETLALPAAELWLGGVSLVHSYAGPPADMRTALARIAAREVAVEELITHRFELDRIQEAFRLLSAGGDAIKIMLGGQVSF
jgi:L-iditol 2-dehydrogenase